MCSLEKGKIVSVQEFEKPAAIKCGTFGASSFEERHLATGDFKGNRQWRIHHQYCRTGWLAIESSARFFFFLVGCGVATKYDCISSGAPTYCTVGMF